MPGNIKGDAAMMQVAVEMAFSQIEEQFREVMKLTYRTIAGTEK